MGRIFYLMGKSSSGKDTVYKELLKDRELALSPVVLYTTRPKRAGEREGQDYHFIGEEGLHSLQLSGRVIEVREYSTVHGIWKYATVDDGTAAAGIRILSRPERWSPTRRSAGGTAGKMSFRYI